MMIKNFWITPSLRKRDSRKFAAAKYPQLKEIEGAPSVAERLAKDGDDTTLDPQKHLASIAL